MHNNLLRYLNNGFSSDGVVDSKQGVVGGATLCTLIYFSSSACAPIVVVLNPCTKQLLLPLLTGFMMILT